MRSVFQGEYNKGLDAKGRLILPVRFREELGSRFILTKGLDGCLFIYSPEAWETFSAKLQGLNTSSRDARRLVRYFIGSSVECEADKQGRFLIPPSLRDFAEIRKDTTVLGVTDRIEIWATDKYRAYLENDDSSIEDIAGGLDF